MRVHNWIILIALAGLTACGQSEQTADDGAASDSGASQAEGTPADDSGTDTTTTEPETDPGDESQTEPPDGQGTSSKACTPEHLDRSSQLAFDLFERAMDVEARSCELLRIDTDQDGDGAAEETLEMSRSLERICDESGDCEQALPSFAWAWSQTSEQSFGMNRTEMYEGIVSGRRLVTEGVETLELTLESNVTGSTADRRIERTYDTEGNVLSEVYSFGGNRWFEVENQWDGEKLVEQLHRDLVNSGGGESVSKWDYDEVGHMISSEYTTTHGRVYNVTFSYDAEGHLVALERLVDGVQWLSQTWTYEGDTLVARHNTILSNGWYQAADDYLAKPLDAYVAHWDESEGIRRGDCELPAFSLIHGYPESEKIYTLGWAREGIPDRVGFAYGYDGFGWNYGDLSWFGHHGIGTQYGPEYFNDGTEVTVSLMYADGLMVEEEISYERSTSEGAELVTINRSRMTDASVVLQDDVITTVTSDQGTETSKQTMALSYDAMGNVVERTLFIDDVYSELSTWQYDGDRRITGHGIYGNSQLWGGPVDDDTTDEVLPHKATYRTTFTDLFLNHEWVREIREQDADAWTPVDSRREAPHERGILIEADNGFVVVDDEGRQVSRGYGDPEAPTYVDTWTEDEYGLLGTWEWLNGDERVSRSYVHVCSE